MFLNEENVTPKLRRMRVKPNKSNMWYLDNRASNHMMGQKDKFQELNRSIQGSVRFDDGSRVRIKGRGTIVFLCKNVEHRILRDVYYIPSLCTNIISLGQLADGGDRIVVTPTNQNG